jgi:hypothetical protein
MRMWGTVQPLAARAARCPQHGPVRRGLLPTCEAEAQVHETSAMHLQWPLTPIELALDEASSD